MVLGKWQEALIKKAKEFFLIVHYKIKVYHYVYSHILNKEKEIIIVLIVSNKLVIDK